MPKPVFSASVVKRLNLSDRLCYLNTFKSYPLEGSVNNFSTHKSAHDSVHNLQFFMRFADGAVKMGDRGYIKEGAHKNVQCTYLCALCYGETEFLNKPLLKNMLIFEMFSSDSYVF